MTTLAHRDTGSLFTDLMTRMGIGTTILAEPQIRIEEFVEEGRRVIKADLPGVDPDKDVEVTVDNGMLRIRAERRAEEHDGARSEIRYGMLERVVSLPPGTQIDDVQAEYADGVLTVSLPTSQQSAPQTVPVRHRELPVE